MKNKIYKTLQLLILSLFILLSGCEIDNETLNTNSENQVVIKKHTFQTANKIEKFHDANLKITDGLNKFREKNKGTSKGEESSFIIDSTTIKEISIGNYTSYTMQILRQEPNDTYFENLVIEVDTLNKTNAYLIKYTPSEQMEYMQEHEEYTFEGNSELSKLYGITSLTGNGWEGGDGTVLIPEGAGCQRVFKCNYGGTVHNAGPNCTRVYSMLDCSPAGTSPGPSGTEIGNNSNPGGTTGVLSGGGGAGTVVTTIVYVPPVAITSVQQFIANLGATKAAAFDRLKPEIKTLINGYITANINNPEELYDANFAMQSLNLNWLFRADLNTQLAIFNYLIANKFNGESQSLVNEIINLAILEPNQQDVNSLINLTIKLEQNGDNLFDDAFIQTFDPYIDLDLANDPDPVPKYLLIGVRTSLNYIHLRRINPEWSKAKCIWNATKEIIHMSLDVYGLIPVGGEIADLINGVLYTIEGDGLNATLSYASTVPIAGWATFGTKYAVKVINTSQTAYAVSTKVKLVWKVTTNGIEFGSRGQLRKVLGLAVGDTRQAHHLIPWAKRTHPAVQKAAKSSSAFHMNEALNGIAVDAWRNQPNHFAYDNRIVNKLDQILATNPNPQQAFDQIESLIGNIRNAINNNPNTHLNDLIF